MTVRLTRFEAGADADAKREFGRTLIAALDSLGVGPGEEFVVLPASAAERTAPGIYDLEHHDDNHVGGFSRGNDTSRKAALDNYPRSGTQRHRVLLAVVRAGDRGVISDELARSEGMRLYSVKPRLIELREGGWVERNGETRPSETGSQVEVYVATEKGRVEARTRGVMA